MAISASRLLTVTFTGDLNEVIQLAANLNAASPGQQEIKTLASGANTITVPTGGTTVVACVIQPPAGNTNTLTFKGVSGDTGVALHKTDPTTIAIDSSVTTFVLTTGGIITGLRLVWV